MNEKLKNINENDRRVKRTKKALRDALLKLLREQPINHISVTELTKLADVNRATFYFYYDDIFDMLEQIQNETYEMLNVLLAEEEFPAFSSTETLTLYIEKVLRFCSDNIEMCIFINSNDINNQFLEKVKSLITGKITDSRNYYGPDDPRRYITQYFLSALSGVVFEWLNDGMKIPPEKLAHTIAVLYFDGATEAKQSK